MENLGFNDFRHEGIKARINFPQRVNEYLFLPKDIQTRIRVLKFEMYNYNRHTYWVQGRINDFPCSRDHDMTNNSCVGCYVIDSDVTEANRLNIKTSSARVLTVYDYRYGHTVIENASGKQKKKLIICQGRGCTACKSGIERFEIGRRFWKLGSGHFNSLVSTNNFIGDRCLSCKEGRIEILTLTCKDCKEDLFSEEKLKDMSDKNLLDTRDAQVACPHCSYVGYPEEVIACSKCENPKRASIYDLDIIVTRMSGGDSKFTNLNIDFSAPLTVFEHKVEAYDFEKIFAPFNLDLQARLLKVDNPFNKERSKRDEEFIEPVKE